MTSRAVQVESQEDVAACLRSAEALGVPALMITPFSGASLHGPRFWAAMEQHCRRSYPGVPFTLYVDCGEEPGIALQALSLGLKTIIFPHHHPSYKRLATVADAHDASIVPPATEILRLPLGATSHTKLALCKDWLSHTNDTTKPSNTNTEVTHAY